MRIERDKEMILVKYQDFTLITIRIYVELRIYELSLLTLLIKTLPAPSEVACLPWNVLCVSVPALGQVLSRCWGQQGEEETSPPQDNVCDQCYHRGMARA